MCSSSTGYSLEGHSTHFQAGRSDLHLPLDLPAEGLQMAHSFSHIPVLRDEVVSLFASVPAGTVVDATVGGGGHSEALLEAYPALRVLGLDRDPVALDAARSRLTSVRGPDHADPVPVLGLVVRRRSPPRAAPLSGVALRPRRQLTPAGRSITGLLVPLRRPARHAHGPVVGPSGRRAGERPLGGRAGCTLPGERRGPPLRPHRTGGRRRPAHRIHRNNSPTWYRPPYRRRYDGRATRRAGCSRRFGLR